MSLLTQNLKKKKKNQRITQLSESCFLIQVMETEEKSNNMTFTDITALKRINNLGKIKQGGERTIW